MPLSVTISHEWKQISAIATPSHFPLMTQYFGGGCISLKTTKNCVISYIALLTPFYVLLESGLKGLNADSECLSTWS